MKIVKVSASSEYNVYIGREILDRVGKMLTEIKKPCKVMLVSDDTVFSLYGERTVASLKDAGFTVFSSVIPHGEESKSLENFERILECSAEANMTRSDLFVALGGGVVGDLTGFAAASFLRGVDFVQIPTTVLSMVDSSVGGKTAINLKAGKNLCGAFHQPVAVYADCDTLSTLPKETFSEGCAEIIKAGMILDAELLKFLENNDIENNVEEVIRRAVEMKRDVVERDEFEKGERKLLNFGHTIGHSIEMCSNFNISHGNAVAIGMVIATRGAYKMGFCDDFSGVLLPLLQKNSLPVSCDFTAEELVKVSLRDKKRSGNDISLIIPECYGHCRIHKIPIEQLKQFIELGLN